MDKLSVENASDGDFGCTILGCFGSSTMSIGWFVIYLCQT